MPVKSGFAESRTRASVVFVKWSQMIKTGLELLLFPSMLNISTRFLQKLVAISGANLGRMSHPGSASSSMDSSTRRFAGSVSSGDLSFSSFDERVAGDFWFRRRSVRCGRSSETLATGSRKPFDNPSCLVFPLGFTRLRPEHGFVLPVKTWYDFLELLAIETTRHAS
eukprot:scaffold7340_cov266-Pinguiococcus_pyrenoidosus.AAC.66